MPSNSMARTERAGKSTAAWRVIRSANRSHVDAAAAYAQTCPYEPSPNGSAADCEKLQPHWHPDNANTCVSGSA